MLDQTAITLNETLAVAPPLDDHAAPLLGDVRPPDEVSEDDASADRCRPCDFSEELVDLVRVEPLADVRERESVDRSVGATAEIRGHATVDQRQPIRGVGSARDRRAGEIE